MTKNSFRHTIFFALTTIAATLLLQCCGSATDYKSSCQGTLYADSTLSVPLAHDTLVITNHNGTIGITITDDSGHFARSFWSNGIDWDNTMTAKFQFEHPLYFICYKGDTLWAGQENGSHKNIVIYPGIDWMKGGYYAY